MRWDWRASKSICNAAMSGADARSRIAAAEAGPRFGAILPDASMRTTAIRRVPGGNKIELAAWDHRDSCAQEDRAVQGGYGGGFWIDGAEVFGTFPDPEECGRVMTASGRVAASD